MPQSSRMIVTFARLALPAGDIGIMGAVSGERGNCGGHEKQQGKHRRSSELVAGGQANLGGPPATGSRGPSLPGNHWSCDARSSFSSAGPMQRLLLDIP